MDEHMDRITQMETILNGGVQVVAQLQAALDAYEALLPKLRALESYYTGPQWLADRDADAQGLLPQDLRRGVLTEDAVYDLLTDMDGIGRRMAEMARKEHDHAER